VSPIVAGVDLIEAATHLETSGWHIPLRNVMVDGMAGMARDYDTILCPDCVFEQTHQANEEFDQEGGFTDDPNQRSDEQYDPDERRLWNKLNLVERRALHPSRLGRVATVDDVREALSARENP
jgi:hypothetical protein